MVVCTDAIAGKPAPTGFVSDADNEYDANPVGVWLAREER
jgi:hypothetical protein